MGYCFSPFRAFQAVESFQNTAEHILFRYLAKTSWSEAESFLELQDRFFQIFRENRLVGSGIVFENCRNDLLRYLDKSGQSESELCLKTAEPICSIFRQQRLVSQPTTNKQQHKKPTTKIKRNQKQQIKQINNQPIACTPVLKATRDLIYFLCIETNKKTNK